MRGRSVKSVIPAKRQRRPGTQGPSAQPLGPGSPLRVARDDGGVEPDRFGDENTFTTTSSKLSRLSTSKPGSKAGASQRSTSFSAMENQLSSRKLSRRFPGLPRNS